MKPWRQEGLFLALCVSAATAISVLSDPAEARFSEAGFGAPPLLMAALATALGTMSIRSLWLRGFFVARSGFGLRRAGIWALAGLAGIILLDIAQPFPVPVSLGWPDAWLYHFALSVIVVAILHLLPLAFFYALTGRARLSILLPALPVAILQSGVWMAPADWHRLAVAGLVATLAITGFVLFRRHGIAALMALWLVHALGWQVLWNSTRLHFMPVP